MNCVIVDDNPLARMAMAELVSQVNGLNNVGECENGIDACNIIREQKVDLLLLDIEMPGASGIDVIKNLGDNSPVIIFTTGKKEYAVDAFDLDVADYIVKPVSPARFFKAIDGNIFGSSNEFFKSLYEDHSSLDCRIYARWH